jgi:hypothetical protein
VQKNDQTDKSTVGLKQKSIVGWNTQKIKMSSRVKNNLIQKNVRWVGCQLRVKNCAKQNGENTSNEYVFKIECCGSYGQLPTERTNLERFVDF